LLPLQLGDQNSSLVLLVGVAFAGIAVVVIILALRRTAAMSDELSEQAREKLAAIKPSPEREAATRPAGGSQAPISRDIRTPDAGTYTTLRTTQPDFSGQVERFAREVTSLKEKQNALRNDMDAVKTEVRALKERISGTTMEIHKLRTMLEEEKASIQKQIQELRTPPPPAPQPPPQAPPTPAYAEPRPPEQPRVLEWQPPPPAPTSFVPFQKRTCARCGRELGPEARFCDNCGSRAL